MSYAIDMAEDKQKMNKYETELCGTLTDIMKQEEVNFSVFLPALVEEVPEKSADEYLKVLKKEQMKLRRGSLSIQEVHKMLNIIGWDFKLIHDRKPIELIKYTLDEKVRFTDLMKVAELLGIEIKWVKAPDRTKIYDKK